MTPETLPAELVAEVERLLPCWFDERGRITLRASEGCCQNCEETRPAILELLRDQRRDLMERHQRDVADQAAELLKLREGLFSMKDEHGRQIDTWLATLAERDRTIEGFRERAKRHDAEINEAWSPVGNFDGTDSGLTLGQNFTRVATERDQLRATLGELDAAWRCLAEFPGAAGSEEWCRADDRLTAARRAAGLEKPKN